MRQHLEATPIDRRSERLRQEASPHLEVEVTAIGDLRASPSWLRPEPTVVEGNVEAHMVGPGIRVTIEDPSGRLEVWVPWEVDHFADAFTGGRLQLTVVRSGGQPAIDRLRTEHATAVDVIEEGRMTEAVEVGMRLSSFLHPETAEAVAVEVRKVGSTTRQLTRNARPSTRGATPHGGPGLPG